MTSPDSSIIKSLFKLYRAGDYRALLEQTRSLLAAHPGELALHSLSGSAYLELEDFESAINSYQKALAIKPDFAKLHNSLGIAYLRTGQLEQAAGSFHNAVKHDSQFAQAWFNLGIVYENRRRLPEAAGYFKTATQLNPVYYQAFSSLAKVLWELRITEQVAEFYEKALAVEKAYLPAHLGLLHFLEQSNQHEKLHDAVSRARKALGPHVVVRLYEGILTDINGKHEEAKTLLEDITIEPTDAWTRYGERTRLARLAHICDRLNDTTAAFQFALRANGLSQEISDGKGIDKASFLQFVEHRRTYFVSENIKQWPDYAPGDGLQVRPRPGDKSVPGRGNEPVFIIGFPRSGTTLLDTLLRGHPSIEVAEEIDAVPRMVNRLSGDADERLDALATLSDSDGESCRRTYLDTLARHVKPENDSAILIDRFALNIIYTGEIVRLFPQARFILLLRHPADCVLSCFMQTFYETSANASFFTLEDSAHLYDQVFGLWRQYTDTLQLNILQVKYEDLIADVESTCRRITDFLEMPWHPGILEHERTAGDRPLIGTASYNQVTRPLYTEARERWQRYRAEMQSVLPVLEPWIRYFEYQ
ncbi:MAG: sulfotransferase [Gammaproteobacteria bacterium]|nr:sulfotransferase [Gammaproteobacteria bacterium]